MSERIWGALRKNALYKSTYTLLYFTVQKSVATMNDTVWLARQFDNTYA